MLEQVFLARHGETEWSLLGKHTGLTDVPLTRRGELDATRLGARLRDRPFAKVLTSPLRRASRTCELAGFGAVAEVDPDLVEWDYGAYEGRQSDDIRRERPDWDLFRDGCPNGDTPEKVGERADRVVHRIRAIHGDVLIFSSAHFLRVLTVRWLALPPYDGKYLFLGTASLSVLGYESDRNDPVIRLWNDTSSPSPTSEGVIRPSVA